MNEKTLVTLKLVLSHLLLPCVLCFSLVLLRNDDKDFLFYFTIVELVIFVVYQCGYWEFWGYRFRNLFVGLLELVILALVITTRPAMMPGMHPLTILLVLIVLILALEVVEIMIVRWRSEKKEIELAFPFRDGKYVITDGGNSKTSRLMNYHYYSPIHRKNHTNNSMMFAANIVKLERGRGGNGFLPKRLEGYHIWREEIHSPMSGKIIKVIDDIPDNEPFCGKYPYNAGNTVVIQKENKFLLLGHMRRGSMRVREGEMVEANHIIGEVGSSGMSERPHLHMQLMTSDSGNYWSGMGVSIQYRGINLYKNRIVEM